MVKKQGAMSEVWTYCNPHDSKAVLETSKALYLSAQCWPTPV